MSAPHFIINDIQIGHKSYVASMGDIPGDAFAVDLDRIEQAAKSGRVDLIEDLKLDLPLLEVGDTIRLRVTSICGHVTDLRGAIELTTQDDDDPKMVGSSDRHVVLVGGGDKPLIVCRDGTIWRFEHYGADGTYRWQYVQPIPLTTKAALKSRGDSNG